MTTSTTSAIPLRDRAIAALRARDEAAAYAVPQGAFRDAAERARTALAVLLGLPHEAVTASIGPPGGLVLPVTDPASGRSLTFYAEHTCQPPESLPAQQGIRFHVLLPCPSCDRLGPHGVIHHLADLGAHFVPRDPDAYPEQVTLAPHFADPVWHEPGCPLAAHTSVAASSHTHPTRAEPVAPQGRADRAGWAVEFRNSADQTVAHASYNVRYDSDGIADRVTADLEIYFSWLVKDALVRRAHGVCTALVVANPAYARTLADQDRTTGREQGDG
ncbi:hypothetical protein [Yinghuangia seranimata]|uniref:hypothetical protein n=1 Tax=Yinghuangia seranimata TaxID=408067 RepID=UPI00248B26B4|nr:hypothetical protein [Yinghuangia seranimata]MDI2130587.1 hypothetical protein [Yinghuangia seranimata]